MFRGSVCVSGSWFCWLFSLWACLFVDRPLVLGLVRCYLPVRLCPCNTAAGYEAIYLIRTASVHSVVILCFLATKGTRECFRPVERYLSDLLRGTSQQAVKNNPEVLLLDLASPVCMHGVPSKGMSRILRSCRPHVDTNALKTCTPSHVVLRSSGLGHLASSEQNMTQCRWQQRGGVGQLQTRGTWTPQQRELRGAYDIVVTRYIMYVH